MINELVLSPTIKQLDAYCQKMAERVIPWLSQIDLSQYQNFLNMMYHYTKESGNRLQFAAQEAHTPQIQAILKELAREEQYHYRLAEADLASFGSMPTRDKPEVVTNFHQFWMGISPENEYQFVGALYVLENVARFLKAHIMPHFARLQVGPEQAKFILTHLVADDDHGDQLRLLCQEINAQAELQLKIGAQKGSDFWVEIHRQALS